MVAVSVALRVCLAGAHLEPPHEQHLPEQFVVELHPFRVELLSESRL